MQISKMLITPSLEKLRLEFEALEQKINSRKSEDFTNLSSSMHKKLAQIEMLRQDLEKREKIDKVDLEKVHRIFRQLKLDRRFTQRKLLRYLLTQNRTERTQNGEKDHVITQAA